jgi:hypothetical protein
LEGLRAHPVRDTTNAIDDLSGVASVELYRSSLNNETWDD